MKLNKSFVALAIILSTLAPIKNTNAQSDPAPVLYGVSHKRAITLPLYLVSTYLDKTSGYGWGKRGTPYQANPLTNKVLKEAFYATPFGYNTFFLVVVDYRNNTGYVRKYVTNCSAKTQVGYTLNRNLAFVRVESLRTVIGCGIR